MPLYAPEWPVRKTKVAYIECQMRGLHDDLPRYPYIIRFYDDSALVKTVELGSLREAYKQCRAAGYRYELISRNPHRK